MRTRSTTVLCQLLLLCVTTPLALGQTTSRLDCFTEATTNFAVQNIQCGTLLSQTISDQDGSSRVSFCGSSCATAANDFYLSACGLAISELLCTREMGSAGYCYTISNAQGVGTMIGQVIGGACLGVDCNNSACNNAVQNLSCCVNTVTTFTQEVTGIDLNLLPEGCSVPQCPAAMFGGPGGTESTESPTTSRSDCFIQATTNFALQNIQCGTLLSQTINDQDGSNRASFCGSSCATTANDFYMSACGFAISELLCTREMGSASYCYTTNNAQAVGTMIGQVIGGACLGVDCSNSACNDAVQNLSCCVNTVTTFTQEVTGIDLNFLPEGCSVPQCPAAMFGGPGGTEATESSSQTTSRSECFIQASLNFAAQNSQCATTLSATTAVTSDDSDRAIFCGSSCSTIASNFFMSACGIDISEILCTRETGSNDYCYSANKAQSIVQMINQVNGGACLGVDCSNSACNDAVQSLSCCVNTVNTFIQDVTGGGSSLLPDGCSVSQCPAAVFGVGGGASGLFALPVVTITAIAAALAF